MAPLAIASSVCFIFTLLVTPILAASPCVTVTKTTTHSSCPPTTPSICPTPDCIELSILDVPCGCPTVVPTYTTYQACHTQCEEGCGVFYETAIASCATSTSYTSTSTISSTLSTITTPPTQPSSCATITTTTGPLCPPFTCNTIEECIEEISVTLSCGCSSIGVVASCNTGCKLACQTTYDTIYLPCPMTLTSA